MRTRKAQLAYEFLLLFFFLTMLFTTGVILVGAAKERITDEANLLHLDDFGRSLQDDFYTAIQMPEGFTRNITLPVTINNNPYTTNITEYEGAFYLEVSTQEMTITYRLPALTFVSQLKQLPGTNTFTKQGAAITLT